MYCCTTCGIALESLAQLELHRMIHTNSDDTRCVVQLPITYSSGTDVSVSSSGTRGRICSGSDMGQGRRLSLLTTDASVLSLEISPNFSAAGRESALSVPGLEKVSVFLPAKEMYMYDKMRLLNAKSKKHGEVEKVSKDLDRLQVEVENVKSLLGILPTAPKRDSGLICENPSPQDQVVQCNPGVNRSLSSGSFLPLPSESTLRAMSYKITMDRLDGIDIQAPLQDIVITIEKYHLLRGLEDGVLESLGREVYKDFYIGRTGNSSFEFTLKHPLEFTVRQDYDLHVFIIIFLYRGNLLFWASYLAHQVGPWLCPLRHPPVDVSTAMNMTDNCFKKAMIYGTLGYEHQDVLKEADLYMRSVSAVSQGGARLMTLLPSSTPALGIGNMNAVETPHWTLHFDNVGRLVVPDDYKSLSRCNRRFSGLDDESEVSTSIMLGFSSVGGRASYKIPDHRALLGRANVSIRCISGLPLNAICFRAVLYLLNYVDPKSGTIVNDTRTSLVFMEPPTIVQCQYPDDVTLYPNLDIEMNGIIVGDQTHIVLIIEYITSRGDGPYVFGHVCLPIHSRCTPGNFISRIKLGDPRWPAARDAGRVGCSLQAMQEEMKRYSEMQIEEMLDSQVLCNRVLSPPSSHAECCPGSFLVWDLNSESNVTYYDVYGQLGPSTGEVLLHQARSTAYVHHKMDIPISRITEVFEGSARLMGNQIGHVVPYDPKRGFFLVVDSLHGMDAQNAVYAVIVDTGIDDPSSLRPTLRRDWHSDVGAPRFDESVHIFSGLTCDPHAVAMLYLLRVEIKNTNTSGNALQPRVQMVGWSTMRLFSHANILRHGRYGLPWFSGLPPDELLDQLQSQIVEVALANWIREDRIKYMVPYSTAVVSIGDPILARQILLDHPGRPLPQQLFVSHEVKDIFPCGGCAGAVGRTQQQLVESMGLPLWLVDNAVNASIRAYAHAGHVN